MLRAILSLLLASGSPELPPPAQERPASAAAEELVSQFRLQQRRVFLERYLRDFEAELAHGLQLTAAERQALSDTLTARRPQLERALVAFDQRGDSREARILVRKAVSGTREAVWEVLSPHHRQKLQARVEVHAESRLAQLGGRIRALFERAQPTRLEGEAAAVEATAPKAGKKRGKGKGAGKKRGGRKRSPF